MIDIRRLRVNANSHAHALACWGLVVLAGAGSALWTHLSPKRKTLRRELTRHRVDPDLPPVFPSRCSFCGYYDSGYVQPVDFFGDGTRIPLIVVAPYVKPGHISHEYAHHVSILKFIERNWGLPAVTHRSRDNFPNPIVREDDPCR